MMGEVSRPKEFENIFMGAKMCQYIKGKIKFAEAGIGFKESETGQVHTMPATEFKKMQWTRVAREFELKIVKKDRSVLKFDGFPREAFEGLVSLVKSYYQLNLETQEMSLRGWNWGRTDFQPNGLSFVVGNKAAFEIPLNEIANTTLPSKAEVSVEFSTPTEKDGKKSKDDTLVELRFYVPGTATLGQVEESELEIKTSNSKAPSNSDGEGEGQENGERERQEDGEIADDLDEIALGEDGEAITAATLLYDTIKERANVGAVIGEAIVTVQGMLSVTPRGRFDVEMHTDFFRLRGKSHDYKINYSAIVRLFSLAKPDEMHQMFVIGLDPPLRQGQTRYPYLVFQFEKEEEIELELNLEEELLNTTYKDRLLKTYDAPSFEVIPELFKGLAERKVIESKSYKTVHNHSGIKCFFKANEALLYPLERSFLSIPKPPMFLPHSQISLVSFARVGGGVTSSTKSFEVKFSMNNGQEYLFTSIPREEFQSLESFCRQKSLRVEKEFAEDAPVYGFDGSSDEDVDEPILSKRPREDGDEDESSEDEDFIAKDSGSDVDEEFNSDFSGSDASDQESSTVPAQPASSAKIFKSASRVNSRESSVAASREASPKPQKSKEKSEKSGKPPKKKQKKDKNAPKRPLSSYMFFTQDQRANVVAQNPGLSITEQAKLLGQLWKETSAEDRTKYEKMAADAKVKYAQDMKNYQATLTSSAENQVADEPSDAGNGENSDE